jgi:hypothetical protein
MRIRINVHHRPRRRRCGTPAIISTLRTFLFAITTWFLLPSRGEVLGIADEVISRRGKVLRRRNRSLFFSVVDVRRYSAFDMSCFAHMIVTIIVKPRVSESALKIKIRFGLWLYCEDSFDHMLQSCLHWLFESYNVLYISTVLSPFFNLYLYRI